MLIDQLILSERKSITLTIESDGKLVVRAPTRLPQREIQRFVDQHADWVREKRAYLEAHPPAVKHHYKSDEHFHYLGQPVRLEVVIRQRPVVHQPLRYLPASAGSEAVFEIVKTTQTQARELLVSWYKKQARQVCTERTASLAKQHGFQYSRLRITSARTRWGSCSSKGTISFTWRLVMLPPEIIDYVVLHELVHTVEHNHSAKFWGRVEALLPDYKKRRAWLKKNSGIFSF
jgi:hypothetical protein